MSTALDILVIIIVAVLAFLGFKKGIAKTGVSIAGTVLASVLTMFLSNPIAEAIYRGGFRTTIIEKTEDATKLFKQSGKGSLIESILKTMPKFVNYSLSNFGISQKQLSSAASKSPEEVEKLIAPIVISFISVFVSIGLFILLSVIIKLVSKALCAAIDDSYLSTINRFFGGVVGIIEGFVIVIVAAFVIRITTPHLKEIPEIISDDSISQSTVFKGIYDSPILTDFIASNTKSPNTEAVE